MMAHPHGVPHDTYEIILPPEALDPRDIREIILPFDGPRWNLYKVILPSCGNQTCNFTFLPLDGPVVRVFFHSTLLNTEYTSDHGHLYSPPPPT
jgi:hypothetical protein